MMKQATRRIHDELIGRLPELGACDADLLAVFTLLRQTYERGGKLLICGNGGSAADSGHIAGELMKGFLLKRELTKDEKAAFAGLDPQSAAALASGLQRALPAISLPDQTSVLTAYANDVSADLAYAQLVYGLGRPGDALLAISTSGNSANVANAAMAARCAGLTALGLTGRGGGRLAALCDAAVRAPADETYRVQEYHLGIYHALCAMLEFEFFGE